MFAVIFVTMQKVLFCGSDKLLYNFITILFLGL